MMIVSVNQTLALPAGRDLARCLPTAPRPGTWGGAGGGQAAGRTRAALRVGQPATGPRLAAARLRPIRTSTRSIATGPAARRRATSLRMRDGVKRALEFIRTGAFDASFEHIAIDVTGRGIDQRCRMTRRSMRG